MKFGKEFASQMVQEWQPAYVDYNYLKTLLKDVRVRSSGRRNSVSASDSAASRKRSLKRRMSLYRAYSGLTCISRKGSPKIEDEVILVSEDDESQGSYQTMFLRPADEGGEVEVVFFKKLDAEFNKVLQFYKEKVNEVKNEAEELSKQMDALIALRIKVEYPLLEFTTRSSDRATVSPQLAKSPSPKSDGTRKGWEISMETIQEVETSREGVLMVEERPERANGIKLNTEGFKPPPLQVLGQLRINVEPQTPVSTLKNVFNSSKCDLSFSKGELKKAEETLKQAFVEFHHKLRLLKSYSFLNVLAFSKIMKKYDKVTSRNASKSYMKMVDNSYLGSSDEITRLTERVEATVVKHFSNGNQSEGMKLLRPEAKRERHRVTFFLGLFCGSTIALQAAIAVSLQARRLLGNVEGRNQYMKNIFPLYSLFGFIVLHMVLYSGNIYLWRRFRVNYPFIFGVKEGKGSMGYRDVLLVASGLSVLTLAAVLSNLDLEMDSRTGNYKTLTELVPLCLVILVLLILFCPFNIIYRSSRFSLIRSSWHCLCAPLCKVTLPDFFLADQLTSQVQAIRCLEFYVCYYGWGDFKKRTNSCRKSQIYQIFYIIIAIVPFWARLLQCLRRWFDEEDDVQLLNGLKYFSTVVALVMRTLYDLRKGTTWRVMAAATSGFTTIFNTYWDIFKDWGLLQRNFKNPWLRDKLLVPNKNVYFAAMVINVLLRLVWMQLVLDFQAPFLHETAMIAVIACLEIIRRCIWNFFRLENEHLNNVGKYRAFKSVPLPFYYDEGKSM